MTEAKLAACDAYWSAKSHAEEHAAVQRMIALGLNDNGYAPCPEPECVALRAETTRQAGTSDHRAKFLVALGHDRNGGINGIRDEIIERLKRAKAGDRALDWRVYAAAVNRDAAARLGVPGQWCPRDIEDREFARYADVHHIPRYTDNLPFAIWLVEISDGAFVEKVT